jgi:arylesterase/paraoxonase
MRRRKVIITTITIIVAIGLYAFHIFNSTGFFREIENSFTGKIYKSVSIPGAEDMQISYEDNFIVISSDDRASRRDGNAQQGNLYYINLNDTSFTPIQLTTNLPFTFYPHGISMVKIDSSNYKVYAINHVKGEHSIEVFNLQKDSLTYIETIKDKSFVSPNDIVAIDKNRYYFTNDHGYTKGFMKLVEEYLGFAFSDVMYYDGNEFKQVAKDIAYANGINYDQERELMFVASPRSFTVKVYQVDGDGNLVFLEDINTGTGVDNIEFDASGKIWIGSHPSLLTFASFSKGSRTSAPSEIITIDYRGEGDYDFETVFLDKGQVISSSTVASVFNNFVFIGSVLDDHFVIWDTKGNLD